MQARSLSDSVKWRQKVPAKNCSAAKNTAFNTQSLRWEWRMTRILFRSAFGVFAAVLHITSLKKICKLAPKSARLDLLCDKNQGFPRECLDLLPKFASSAKPLITEFTHTKNHSIPRSTSLSTKIAHPRWKTTSPCDTPSSRPEDSSRKRCRSPIAGRKIE